MEDVLLSPAEAAQKLRINRDVFLRKVRDGSIRPVFRLNKRVIRVPASTLDAYLSKCANAEAQK